MSPIMYCKVRDRMGHRRRHIKRHTPLASGLKPRLQQQERVPTSTGACRTTYGPSIQDMPQPISPTYALAYPVKRNRGTPDEYDDVDAVICKEAGI